MRNAFSDYLPHFKVTALGGLDASERIRPLGRAAAAPPPVNGYAEAEARGHSAGRAEALAEAERMREQDGADFGHRLAERERDFAETTADVLADRLTAGLARIEAAIVGPVGRALIRFLDGAVRQRVLDELVQTVTSLLTSDGGVRLRMIGPEALVARVSERLAGCGNAIECIVDDGRSDVTVTVDDTIVETRIAAWAERIANASEEPHG